MSSGKEQWGSRIGVILAVAGSAVGLGNFLRFPGNAAENGGGAFMIPYFCALLFLGIPIGWAEWAMGRYGGRKGFHSAPAIMGVFGKGAVGRYVGVIGVLIPVVVYFYYVIIESWCLAYFWKYLTGGIGIVDGQSVAEQVATSKSFFEQISGSGIDGVTVGGDVHISLVIWAITFALNVYFIWRGLSKGVEWVCKWAMPTMAIIGIIVLVRVLTLGTPDPAKPDQSVIAGLGFMWNPDFSKLGDFKTWLAAAGQIFFSLSVGFGVILNYASYMKRKDDVVLSGLTASATNEFFEVALGGLITVTAAVVFLGIATTSMATGSSFSLGFNTLPVVFARMPGGDFFGAIWFLMLFLAAITSSLSMLQPAAAFVMEALGLKRGPATAVVSIGCLAGSFFVLWFSKGLVALDTLDFWVGSFMIFIMAAAQIICFGWVFGLGRGIEEAHEGAHVHIPKVFQFIIKYVAPVYLIVIFVGFCTRNLPAYVETILDQENPAHRNAQLAWIVIGTVIAILVTVTALGARRWRAQGLDLDGDREPDDVSPGR
ncbi:MAG: sodium-dependent transporter [Planctomycetota bacterium]